jgi:hypothetical protein
VHTYLELFARYFIDLTPNVALIAAVSADRDGNLAELVAMRFERSLGRHEDRLLFTT